MVARNVFGWGALMACLLVPPMKAQRVLLLPGASSNVSVIAADTFTAMAPISASPQAFAILPNPSGDRYFIVSGANVTVVDSAGNSIQSPVAVGKPISAAALTSDGKKLLVAAGSSSSGTLYVFDITSGATEQLAAIPTGFNPISVAPGLDPGSAYIVTNSGLSKVDLAANTVSATLGLSGVSAPDSRVAVGPNGLVYVTAEGALHEVDPRTMTVRKSITMNAFPTKPVFTPDGASALLANPGANDTIQPALMKVDLGTYAITSVKWWGVSMSSLIWAKPDRLYAYSNSHRKLYQLTNDLGGVEEASLPGVGSIPTVLAAFTSTEFPTINDRLARKYLFVVAQTALYRIDLDPPAGAAPNQITKSLPIAAPSPGGIYFAPPAAANSTVVTIMKFGENQDLAPAGVSAPLVIRALDQTGKPIMGVPVTFVASEGQIAASMQQTNSEGLAQAIVKVPALGGSFTVTATPLTGAGAVFALSTDSTPGEPGGGGDGPGAAGISITSGNGQVMNGGSFAQEPLGVIVRDAKGGAIAGAKVTFSFAASMSGILTGANCTAGTGGGVVCTTDSAGRTAVAYLAPSVRAEERSYFQTTVTATVAGLSGAANQSVTFYETAVPELAFGQNGPLQGQKLLAPANQGATLTVQAGQKATGAIKVQVFAQSGPNAFSTIPNVGLIARGTKLFDPETPSPAYCSGGFALSGPDGVATCDLVVPASTAAGTYPIWAVIAGNTSLGFTLVVEGAPAPVPVPTTVTPISGNGQSGSAGQTINLVAGVKDQFGANMANTTVTWTLVSGSATLTPGGTKTGTDGRTSAAVVLGATPGAVVVQVSAGSARTTFNLTVTVALGNVTMVSGDGQSVVVGQQFQPVSVKVTDAQGNAVAGVAVTFNATGGAIPASDTAVTNASGVAQATFTAPNNPGQVAVTASAGGKSFTFNLAARLPGPVLTTGSFLNAASLQPGIGFGSIVAIKSDGLTTGLTIPPGSCLTEAADGNIQRELPTRLAGIEVRFEWVHLAPIFAICKNSDGSEQINVQAPFDLAPAKINVSVTTGIGTASEMTASVGGVDLTNAMPGIFEYEVSSTTRAAVALRPDGTVVSPTNKAKRGEVLRVFTTGLGPVLPVGGVPVKTNQPGYPGQKPYFTTSVQLGGSGVPGVSAEYAQNLIGIFVVTFQVPADAQISDAAPLVVSVLKDNGETVSSKASSIPISD